MKYLEKLDFTLEEIDQILENTSLAMVKLLEENRKLVSTNLSFLKELGAKNYKAVFQNYYELFLLDNSNFVEIFNKYDRDDLIEKLEKNIAILEYL